MSSAETLPADAAPAAPSAVSPLAFPEPWNLVADGYADEAHHIMGPFSERAIAIAGVGPDDEVLDVAAGSGATSLALASRVRRVAALDFAPAMLARLARAATERGLANIDVREGDGQALPWEASRFDAAFSMFGLMFFPDRARGFAELLRVLRPGGVAVVGSWAPMETSSLMGAMMEAVAVVSAAPTGGPQPSFPLSSPDVFAREMQDAGFVDVTVEPHELTIEVPDVDALWEGMARSNVMLVMLRRRLGEAVWSERQALARARLAEHLVAGPPHLSTTALLGRGTRPA